MFRYTIMKGMENMNSDAANNLRGSLDSALKSIKELAGTGTVIGDPITTPSGTVIIPVSKVSMGIATGGLDYGKKSAEKAPDGQKRPAGKSFGGGGGTGISVTPVAFLVVGPEGGVEMLSVGADVPPAGPVESLASLIEKSPDILSRLRGVFKSFKGDKSEDSGAVAGQPDKDSKTADGDKGQE